jgi:aminopeptidase C
MALLYSQFRFCWQEMSKVNGWFENVCKSNNKLLASRFLDFLLTLKFKL